MTLEGSLQGDRVGEVEPDGLDARGAERLQRGLGAVRDRDGVVAGLVEHVGDGGADLAGADDEN